LTGPTEREAPAGASLGRKVAIGCLSLWLGTTSGAMVGAFASKIVAYLTHGPACDGIPACDWYIYAGVGAVIGAITLPALVLWVVGKPKDPS
jgi:hypothetical protein